MAKNTASNLLSSTKKGFFRATQQIKEQFGKSEKTVDISYDQEVERFRAHHKAVKKMNRDAVKYLETLRELSVLQSTIAENFYNMYEPKHSLYNAALKNQDAMKFVDNSRIQLDEQMRHDFVEPLTKYRGQFKDIKSRIENNKKRRVDMDRYFEDLKGYQKGSNTHKIPAAELKYKLAKANYQALTAELLRDMPALFEDRDKFFDPCLATYVASIAEYYRQSAKSTVDSVPVISHIDRTAVRDHPRIVEPQDSSAAIRIITNLEGVDGVSLSASGSSSTMASPTTPAASQYKEVSPTAAAYGATGATAATAKRLPQAKALFDFEASEANELTFHAGEILNIHSQNSDWWEAENAAGRKGLIPRNYVQPL